MFLSPSLRFHCTLSSKPEFCASLLERRFVLEDKKQMLFTDNLFSGLWKHTGGRVGKSVFGIEWGGGREKRWVRDRVEVISGASKALVEDAWKADLQELDLGLRSPSISKPTSVGATELPAWKGPRASGWWCLAHWCVLSAWNNACPLVSFQYLLNEWNQWKTFWTEVPSFISEALYKFLEILWDSEKWQLPHLLPTTTVSYIDFLLFWQDGRSEWDLIWFLSQLQFRSGMHIHTKMWLWLFPCLDYCK